MPRLRESMQMRWPTLIPLILLISILVSGRTPYLAAFVGISSCAIVGMTTRVSGNQLKNWGLLLVMHIFLMTIAFSDFGNDNSTIKIVLFVVAVLTGAAAYIWGGVRGRIEPHVLVEALETGAKYALAVGAAAATVGIVIGVVTLTGVGFKISYIITQAAQSISAVMGGIIPSDWMSLNTLTLLAALIMTGLVCILMGCGVPTTATYIIMVTVAAPTLVGLGVEPLVAHFFVFYYGVLADITPPVALAAYAAAGMAGSDPFKTGNTAFRLGLAKALVPFVFVFSPSLLLVAKGFTWESFIITFTGCVMGITLMAAALSKFMLVEMKRWEQLSCLFAALLMIAPSLTATIVGMVIVIPMMVNQFQRAKLAPVGSS
jgi:TRAP transporter 4TM/12TM fusion protein